MSSTGYRKTTLQPWSGEGRGNQPLTLTTRRSSARQVGSELRVVAQLNVGRLPQPTFEGMLRLSRIAVSALLSVSACGSSDHESPLAGLEGATRVQLQVAREGSGRGDTSTLTDLATIRRLAQLATTRGDWEPTWHTEPSGQVRAAFFRDTAYLGVLSLGEGWVGAQGLERKSHFRSMKTGEAQVVVELRRAGYGAGS